MADTTDSVSAIQARCEAATRRAERLEQALAETRRDAQRQIDAALADLRLAQRIARIGNWSLDPAVGLPVWSDEVYSIYERDPNLGPIPLAEYRALYSGRDWETFNTAITTAIEDGTPYDIELHLELPSGNSKWIQAICEPEPEPGPSGHALRGTIQDITDRKTAEETRRDQDRRFRSLVESVNDIIYAVEPDGTFTYVSPNWTEFMGEPPSEAVGASYEPYLHPDDLHICQDFLELVLTTGEPQSSIEYRVRRADGEWRWHVSNGAPVRDDSGEVTGYVGVARDVTEDRRSREALAESRARYRLLAENFPNGALFLDNRDWRYLSADGQAFAQAGLASDQVVGRTVQEVFPELWEVLEPNLSRAFEGEPVTYELEYRGRWYTNQVVPVPGEDGAVDQVIVVTQDITGRRQAEEKLRAQRQMLADAERLAGVGSCVWHLPTGRMEFSDGWLAIHGCERPPTDVDDMIRLAHPEDLPAIQAAMEAVVSGRQTYELEHRIVRRNTGEVRVLRAYGVATQLVDGQVATIHGAALDITDRRRMEAELRDRQLEVEQILQALPDALVYADPDRRIARVNRHFEALFGYSEAEALGRETKLIYADPEVFAEQGRLRYNRQARDTFEPYVIEYRRNDGSVFPGETVGTPVRNANDEVVGLLGMVRDITERHEAEAALRESEERFRSLLDDIAMVSVQGYAPDGTTIFWNEGSRRLYGYTAAEALGRSLLDLIIPPEMRDDVGEAMAEMARPGVPIPPSELKLMRKDGSRVTVYSSHCILAPRGRPQELYCIDVDLTAIRTAEAERERLREQLAQAQKMESVGRLAGGVAHDFNNMLSVILGHAEIATMSSAPDAPDRVHLDEIRRAAERSANLVRQLLAFARRQTVAPRELDLNETIGDMLSMLRRLIGENIELVWSPGDRLDAVRMDPAQIDQMLANLVVNARDAIDGVGRIHISTRPVRPGEPPGDVLWDRGVAVEVADDGHGMDEATQEQIFEPFFTTKGVGEGTGLGLATVYGIVRQNRGTITVESRPGEGACFTAFLPSAPRTDRVTGSAAPDLTNLPTGSETVLLVEDESSVVALGRRMLEGLGYQVFTASNPAEAMRLAKRHQKTVQLLLTDVVMPQMNGRDLARLLVEEIPGLAVLYMSGHTTDVISDDGELAEDVRFLAKPFSLRDLAVAVRTTLDGNAS